MCANLSLDFDQATAFRLSRHNLARRLPAGSLLAAAAACGIQNTPRGSASLSLQARVASLDPALIDRTVRVDKTLVQFWSLRRAPHVVPTSDVPVYTTGLLPADDLSYRHFIAGASPALDFLGLGVDELVERVSNALQDVLDDQGFATSAGDATGVRLLPPHDPFLQIRDRTTLIPDPFIRQRIWRLAGSPGVVLAGGRVVALWRARKAGKRLMLEVEPVTAIPRQIRLEIQTEAESVAAYRGCRTCVVHFVE